MMEKYIGDVVMVTDVMRFYPDRVGGDVGYCVTTTYEPLDNGMFKRTISINREDDEVCEVAATEVIKHIKHVIMHNDPMYCIDFYPIYEESEETEG